MSSIATAVQPRQSDVIDEFMDRIDTITDRLRGRTHEVNLIFDRVVGLSPEKMPTAAGSTLQPPAARNLEAAISRLAGALDDLESAISRARR